MYIPVSILILQGVWLKLSTFALDLAMTFTTAMISKMLVQSCVFNVIQFKMYFIALPLFILFSDRKIVWRGAFKSRYSMGRLLLSL